MSLVNESVRITNEINLCIFYRRMIFEIEYFADCFFGLIRFLCYVGFEFWKNAGRKKLFDILIRFGISREYLSNLLWNIFC